MRIGVIVLFIAQIAQNEGNYVKGETCNYHEPLEWSALRIGESEINHCNSTKWVCIVYPQAANEVLACFCVEVQLTLGFQLYTLKVTKISSGGGLMYVYSQSLGAIPHRFSAPTSMPISNELKYIYFFNFLIILSVIF